MCPSIMALLYYVERLGNTKIFPVTRENAADDTVGKIQVKFIRWNTFE